MQVEFHCAGAVRAIWMQLFNSGFSSMHLLLVLALYAVLLFQPVCAFIRVASTALRPTAKAAATATADRETDVVVIGSGIGGLSAATLSARYGLATEVFEAHYHPGGVAHSFEEQGFKFDAGTAASYCTICNNACSKLLEYASM
jgi:NAD(P)-binding Rossmann-like domain